MFTILLLLLPAQPDLSLSVNAARDGQVALVVSQTRRHYLRSLIAAPFRAKPFRRHRCPCICVPPPPQPTPAPPEPPPPAPPERLPSILRRACVTGACHFNQTFPR